MSFNLSFNPVWDFVDLVGYQLDDTYFMFTLQNTLPYLFSPIASDVNGTPWSDPIRFLANGTLPVNMYWDSTQVYRLEIRKGNTQADPLIYLIENYIPSGAGGDTPITMPNITTQNQITNPQFATVNFELANGMSFTGTGPVDFAPGWQITTAGSGTITVSQDVYPGSDNTDSNPSYGISIGNSGIGEVILQQTFQGNGALWANEAISFYGVGSATQPTTISIQLNFSTGPSVPIGDFTLLAGSSPFQFSVPIPASINTDVPPAAYTQLAISWTGSSTVSLSSLQLIGLEEPLSEGIGLPYLQTTLEQQKNGEFWYYNPQLQQKPIPSYTIGWDFAYNPCQALGSTVLVTGSVTPNTARYIADQTIAFESVGNKLSYTFGSPGGLLVSTTAETQFAILQYLDLAEAAELLSNPMASAISCAVTTGTITGNISLWYTTDSTLPNMPISTNHATFFPSLTAGVPTPPGGNWHEVTRSDLGTASFTVNGGVLQNVFNFNGWSAESAASSAKYFAIVVGFNTLASTQVLNIQWCSLCAGYFATEPAYLNKAQTLQALQYYYEQSYAAGGVPSQVDCLNSETVFFFRKTGGTVISQAIGPAGFDVRWDAIKRVAPSPIVKPIIYAIDATINAVTLIDTLTGVVSNTDRSLATYWNTPDITTKSITFSTSGQPAFKDVVIPDAGGTSTYTSYISFHYVADSRLGQV